MKAWTSPAVPKLAGRPPVLRLHDSASSALATPKPGERAAVYVCGITPYDATHLGHAATYVAFDELIRVLRDSGREVRYAQNVTDVDDPLLERASRDGVDWRELAAAQVQLFRDDMTALRVIAPDEFVAVTDVVPRVGEAVRELADAGLAYEVAAPDAAVEDASDWYFDTRSASERGTGWRLGAVSGASEEEMLRLSRERGGDPDRPGKRDPLDPLLWRAERAGEPAWSSAVGRGRPGWHIECSVIARDALSGFGPDGADLTVQGGGRDLVFPHHEFSAAHASAISGHPFAELYVHAGMVAYEGEKMSKSLGNLVKVSELRAREVDPAAVRLVLLAEHYRSNWEYDEAKLTAAIARLASWRDAANLVRRAQSDAATTGSRAEGRLPADEVVAHLRAALASDLDTPRALERVDEWAAAVMRAGGRDGDATVVAAIDALLGIEL